MDDDRKALLARITGRVQGVSFRIWTRAEAEKLGLSGWVRNERDGSVSALLVGADAAISAMIDRLWQGPPGAAVTSVTQEEKTDPGDSSEGFRIVG